MADHFKFLILHPVGVSVSPELSLGLTPEVRNW